MINITPKILNEMKSDIERCKNHTIRDGSETLYNELIAKYSVIDADFPNNVKPSGQVAAIGQEFNFCPELKKIAAKLEMMLLISDSQNDNSSQPKSIQEILASDINRTKLYLDSEHHEEQFGKTLYTEITSRYDSIINDFGNGLYSYFAEYHFYDTDVDLGTIDYNLQLLLQKMIIFQATKYSTANKLEIKKSNSNKKVFIVHGHDSGAKNELARTLEHLDLEAIILHEQPDMSRTIIEKIEQNSDVGFAVVLYTECDKGRAKEEPPQNDKNRARQNVVFEHGYLIGKLGRERVCAIVKGEVETPGDISGVVYTAMDSDGAWKLKLCRNMKAVGIDVDMNKLA